MKHGSQDIAFFLVDGRNVLGVLTSVNDAVEATTEETSPLGPDGAWQSNRPVGTKKAELSQDGFFDDAVGSIHDTLNEQQGVSRVVCYGVEGNAVNSGFTGYAGGYFSKYSRLSQRNQLHKANASYAIAGAVEDAVILHPYGARTADDDTEATPADRAADPLAKTTAIVSSSVANPSIITTARPHGLTTGDQVVIAGHASVVPDINSEYTATVIDATHFSIPVNVTDGGAGGTVRRAWTKNGGAGYLQVDALTLGGHDNLTVKIRHSADGLAWADLATFTVVAAAPVAERIVVAAGTTVQRHLAVSWAFTGAGADPSATFLVGFARA
jgi:hypothetical protein